MMEAVTDALARCAKDEAVKAAVITASGKYYCSGVDFFGSMPKMRPSSFVAWVRDLNQGIFDAFLDFPKPLIAAVNGPAIGASVTSAALCDAILAVPSATFHTPFRALGITPEGCSSVNFPDLIGDQNAKVFLEEGRKVDAAEAHRMGFVQEVIEPPESLVQRARVLAASLAEKGQGRRWAKDSQWLETLRRANREESVALAESFLKRPFLEAQYNFAAAKGKAVPKMIFWVAKTFQPLLARL